MNEQLQKLWATLKADKNKLVIMSLLLLLFGLLLWGRLLLKQVPQSAVAEPRQVAPAPSSGNRRPESAERQTLDIELIREATRDIFARDPAFYDKIGPTRQVDQNLRPPRITEMPVPEISPRDLASFELEATMGGVAVISGKVLRRGDQLGDGFVLHKVMQQKVIVKKRDAVATLEMKNPGIGTDD